jgi:hypothetical protein
MKEKNYGGLIRWDHSNKRVYLNRELNPPTHNARFISKLREEHPDYEVVKQYAN